MAFFSITAGLNCQPSAAQDYNLHTLKGTLPAPKLSWHLRGKYTVQLSPASAHDQFKMEICPTYHADVASKVFARVHNVYAAIAKLVCREKKFVLIGKLADNAWVGHGGDSIEGVSGVFQCE